MHPGNDPGPDLPLDEILQSLTDGLLVVDLNKRIVFVNHVLAGMYGFEPRAMIGKSCAELIGFDHCINCPFEDVIQGDGAYTGHNLRCDQIHAGPHCVSVSPYRDDEGTIIGAVEIYRDMQALGAYIEDMEDRNVELAHERQRLDDILTDSSDGYFTASTDRVIQSADSKLLALLGRSEEEVVGQPCPTVFGSDKCETDCPLLWASENDKNVIGCREQISAMGGALPVDKSIFLHKDTEGRLEHLIGVLRNASEIVELRRSAVSASGIHRLVSRNAQMEGVFDLIRIFGPTDTAVLVLGESGTGKELVATSLQQISPRKSRPFVKINCSALAEGLLESELFGHVRGAFTGADKDKRGLFEVADRGTIFLDEVGDMSPKLQAKILRVLEEQEFDKVGGTETLKVDVRVVAATNRDLRRAIGDGSFREDLYYRLNAIQIKIPPLRERTEDVPILVDRFLSELNRTHGNEVHRISARALDHLQRYRWPGNIRELRNAVEFAYLCARSDRIERQDLPESIFLPDGASADPADHRPAIHHPAGSSRDATRIREAMQRFDGNRRQVAEALGISRTTLWRRLKAMGQD